MGNLLVTCPEIGRREGECRPQSRPDGARSSLESGCLRPSGSFTSSSQRLGHSWFLAIWGRDVTWSHVQSIWLVAMVALKLGLVAFALVLVWATTWWRSGTAMRASIANRADEVDASVRAA